MTVWVVYNESIKRELKIRGIYECRCDERPQTKTKEFTLLTYTGLVCSIIQRIKKSAICLSGTCGGFFIQDVSDFPVST